MDNVADCARCGRQFWQKHNQLYCPSCRTKLAAENKKEQRILKQQLTRNQYGRNAAVIVRNMRVERVVLRDRQKKEVRI